MVKNDVFEVVKKADLKPGSEVLDSTWVCKKRSNGTIRGRCNTRGFKKIDGQHYDGSSIHTPVTKSASIRILLTLTLTSNLKAEAVDVKGAFIKGDVENGEEIHIKIPQGWEHNYKDDEVLRLKYCLYGLKQEAVAFWRQLL